MLDRYLQTRIRTTDICSPLQTEDYIPQPVDFVSPAKWHLAHTTWFFEEMILKKYVEGYKVFHPDFSYLFNSYYNTIGSRTLRADRGNITRPTVEEVYEYRKYVDGHMETLLGVASDEVLTLVELGLNHEQQHQELLVTDLKYILGHNPIFPVYAQDGGLMKQKNQNSNWIQQEAGVFEIGHDSEQEFCFDNELGRHKVYLHDFEIANFLVTNGEFIEFIEDGGYNRFELWLDEGWSWVQNNNVESPLYWHKIDDRWMYFTLEGLQTVDTDEILSHVSFYEAAAYAQWKECRLPTEFEWEVVSDKISWGDRWEWTNSAYLPYPGFKIAAGAVGEYNGKFMINQMVLRGASVATAKDHSRKTYRNFFHPHFRWQFSGIRLVK